MAKDKVFRIKDEPGPDYKCSVCGLTGYRLWRDSGFTLQSIDLFCALCAEKKSGKVSKDSPRERVLSGCIGNYVAARPTPEGDTFWGHTSGDTVWWYKLPQYPDDPARELKLVRLERDVFCQQQEYYAGKYLEESKARAKAQRDCDEAIRFAKLEKIPR